MLLWRSNVGMLLWRSNARKPSLLRHRMPFREWKLVGAAGFEPTTTSPPDWCATRLRHAPTNRQSITWTIGTLRPCGTLPPRCALSPSNAQPPSRSFRLPTRGLSRDRAQPAARSPPAARSSRTAAPTDLANRPSRAPWTVPRRQLGRLGASVRCARLDATLGRTSALPLIGGMGQSDGVKRGVRRTTWTHDNRRGQFRPRPGEVRPRRREPPTRPLRGHARPPRGHDRPRGPRSAAAGPVAVGRGQAARSPPATQGHGAHAGRVQSVAGGSPSRSTQRP